MWKKRIVAMAVPMFPGMSACSFTMDESTELVEPPAVEQKTFSDDSAAEEAGELEEDEEMGEAAELPRINAGETATGKSIYVDQNGAAATIPDGFTVSGNNDESMIHTGLVMIGSDESEFVWVPIAETEVVEDSTSWGNYSNNTFADVRGYGETGQWEETKANNIYDLAGNYWEWTQERSGGESYAARAGGYSIMGGACTGYNYPVVFRSGFPGNDHHPNITFRAALYLN